MKPTHQQLIKQIGTDEFTKTVSPLMAELQEKPWKHNFKNSDNCRKCNIYLEETERIEYCTVPDPPQGSIADWSYQLRNLAVEKVGREEYEHKLHFICWHVFKIYSSLAKPEHIIIASLLALGLIE